MFHQRCGMPANRMADLSFCLITSPTEEHQIQESALEKFDTTSHIEIGEGDFSFTNMNATVYGYLLVLDDKIIAGEKLGTPRQLLPTDMLRINVNPVLEGLRLSSCSTSTSTI